MNVIGLSFGYHDSACALLQDGRPTFFASEERYSYKKNDAGFPHGAIEAALQFGTLSEHDLDAVVYYEDPLLKMDRIGSMARRFHPDPDTYLQSLFDGNWDRKEKFDPLGMIEQTLGVDPAKIHFVSHHLSHAALAYFLSPFDRAVVITIDGVGEYDTFCVYLGEDGRLTKVASMSMPNSVGLLYSFFTGYCGFEINEGEYKLMGLSAFGQPMFEADINRWVDLDLDRPVCHSADIQWSVPTDEIVQEPFLARFGKPFEQGRDHHLDTRFTALAASVQSVIEQEIMKLTRASMDRWQCDNVCLGGGVALNCNVNGRIRREVTENLFVPPAPGDAGSALGAAFAHWYMNTPESKDVPKRCVPFSPYLGTDLDHRQFELDFPLYRQLVKVEEVSESETVDRTAACLAEGEVVGWMQGRFEMGPRALGNRSILADPRTGEMKEIVNRRIKNREPFRPFAPAVLMGHEETYFDVPSLAALHDRAPEHFMLATHRIIGKMRKRIEAVAHVDDTSRIQVVSREMNQRFHDLISAFHGLTGTPILLNTSLNVSGQPMASDSSTGMRAFLSSDMDKLVVGNKIVSKRT